jgi:hypothetical protein
MTTNHDKLEALVLAATPGPWKAFNHIRTGTFAVHTPDDEHKGNVVGWGGFDGNRVSKKQSSADARFIAAANPDAVLELLAELKKAKAQIEKLDSAVNEEICNRDHREEIIDALCDAVLGEDRTEWSSQYYFEDAVSDVHEHMYALEQQAEARTALQSAKQVEQP